ncbi:STN domain-containing protein [Bradyrhizobium sp. NAS80.1]|uniref:STN domain-containing protein n=1 Tax=Bradyrhizobium sp. NAS80.1 TaxID=1680159 RepID=UPI001FD9CD0C|nr:STN domain-containing protein [Bradyrhizobium sp. NAS80.1]
MASAAEPESSPRSQPIAFDIPAQSLVSALHAYGRRVGVQVLYDSRSAAGRQSVAVQGRMTPDDALKRLLGNTDLVVRHASREAITLVAPAPLEKQELPPVDALSDADLSLGELRVRATARPNDLERFADYSETVRNEIQYALLKNPRSATGNYRAVLDLWIDPSRTVRKAALLHSTGDDARDSAITTTLQGLTISRPTPADAPQPIRAVVAVSTSK